MMEMTHLDLNSLRPSEVISIQTANSVYQFSVTDPAQCLGVLRGGTLGDRAIIATLLCSLPGKGVTCDWLTLQPGVRAIFFCATSEGVRRLITTRIRKIDCTEAERVEESVSPA